MFYETFENSVNKRPQRSRSWNGGAPPTEDIKQERRWKWLNKEASRTLTFPQIKPSLILHETLGSLDAKLPLIPDTEDFVVLCTTKLGTKRYQTPPDAEFDLSGARRPHIEYNFLHDPYLKEYFSSQAVRKALIDRGLVTKDGYVKCSIREFNDYRQWIRKLKLDKMTKQYREEAIREADERRKQTMSKRTTKSETESIAIMKERHQKALEITEKRRTREEQERNRYLQMKEKDMKRLESFRKESTAKTKETTVSRAADREKRLKKQKEKEDADKKIRIRVLRQNARRDSERKVAIEKNREEVKEIKRAKAEEMWKRRQSYNIDMMEHEVKKFDQEMAQRRKSISYRELKYSKERNRSEVRLRQTMEENRKAAVHHLEEAEQFLHHIEEKKQHEVEKWRKKCAKMQEHEQLDAMIHERRKSVMTSSKKRKPDCKGHSNRSNTKRKSVWDIESCLLLSDDNEDVGHLYKSTSWDNPATVPEEDEDVLEEECREFGKERDETEEEGTDAMKLTESDILNAQEEQKATEEQNIKQEEAIIQTEQTLDSDYKSSEIEIRASYEGHIETVSSDIQEIIPSKTMFDLVSPKLQIENNFEEKRKPTSMQELPCDGISSSALDKSCSAVEMPYKTRVMKNEIEARKSAIAHPRSDCHLDLKLSKAASDSSSHQRCLSAAAQEIAHRAIIYAGGILGWTDDEIMKSIDIDTKISQHEQAMESEIRRKVSSDSFFIRNEAHNLVKLALANAALSLGYDSEEIQNELQSATSSTESFFANDHQIESQETSNLSAPDVLAPSKSAEAFGFTVKELVTTAIFNAAVSIGYQEDEISYVLQGNNLFQKRPSQELKTVSTSENVEQRKSPSDNDDINDPCTTTKSLNDFELKDIGSISSSHPASSIHDPLSDLRHDKNVIEDKVRLAMAKVLVEGTVKAAQKRCRSSTDGTDFENEQLRLNSLEYISSVVGRSVFDMQANHGSSTSSLAAMRGSCFSLNKSKKRKVSVCFDEGSIEKARRESMSMPTNTRRASIAVRLPTPKSSDSEFPEILPESPSKEAIAPEKEEDPFEMDIEYPREVDFLGRERRPTPFFSKDDEDEIVCKLNFHNSTFKEALLSAVCEEEEEEEHDDEEKSNENIVEAEGSASFDNFKEDAENKTLETGMTEVGQNQVSIKYSHEDIQPSDNYESCIDNKTTANEVRRQKSGIVELFDAITVELDTAFKSFLSNKVPRRVVSFQTTSSRGNQMEKETLKMDVEKTNRRAKSAEHLPYRKIFRLSPTEKQETALQPKKSKSSTSADLESESNSESLEKDNCSSFQCQDEGNKSESINDASTEAKESLVLPPIPLNGSGLSGISNVICNNDVTQSTGTLNSDSVAPLSLPKITSVENSRLSIAKASQESGVPSLPQIHASESRLCVTIDPSKCAPGLNPILSDCSEKESDNECQESQDSNGRSNNSSKVVLGTDPSLEKVVMRVEVENRNSLHSKGDMSEVIDPTKTSSKGSISSIKSNAKLNKGKSQSPIQKTSSSRVKTSVPSFARATASSKEKIVNSSSGISPSQRSLSSPSRQKSRASPSFHVASPPTTPQNQSLGNVKGAKKQGGKIKAKSDSKFNRNSSLSGDSNGVVQSKARSYHSTTRPRRAASSSQSVTVNNENLKEANACSVKDSKSSMSGSKKLSTEVCQVNDCAVSDNSTHEEGKTSELLDQEDLQDGHLDKEVDGSSAKNNPEIQDKEGSILNAAGSSKLISSFHEDAINSAETTGEDVDRTKETGKVGSTNDAKLSEIKSDSKPGEEKSVATGEVDVADRTEIISQEDSDALVDKIESQFVEVLYNEGDGHIYSVEESGSWTLIKQDMEMAKEDGGPVSSNEKITVSMEAVKEETTSSKEENEESVSEESSKNSAEKTQQELIEKRKSNEQTHSTASLNENGSTSKLSTISRKVTSRDSLASHGSLSRTAIMERSSSRVMSLKAQASISKSESGNIKHLKKSSEGDVRGTPRSSEVDIISIYKQVEKQETDNDVSLKTSCKSPTTSKENTTLKGSSSTPSIGTNSQHSAISMRTNVEGDKSSIRGSGPNIDENQNQKDAPASSEATLQQQQQSVDAEKNGLVESASKDMESRSSKNTKLISSSSNIKPSSQIISDTSKPSSVKVHRFDSTDGTQKLSKVSLKREDNASNVINTNASSVSRSNVGSAMISDSASSSVRSAREAQMIQTEQQDVFQTTSVINSGGSQSQIQASHMKGSMIFVTPIGSSVDFTTARKSSSENSSNANASQSRLNFSANGSKQSLEGNSDPAPKDQN